LKDRIILAMDNSLGLLCLVLGRGDELIEARLVRGKRTSEILAEEVLSMFKSHGLSLSDLDSLIFTTGPGSYTGLRVVSAFIKGIMVARKIRLLGISTFDLLVSPFSFLSGYYLCPLVDAKMGEVFFALYEVGREGTKIVLGPKCVTAGELPKYLKGPSIVFGSGVPPYASELKKLPNVAYTIEDEFYPPPLLLLREGLRRGTEMEEPRPFYGRRSEAEIRFGVEFT